MRGRWVQVLHFSTCRRCGANDLAWLKSKHGNWYLTRARHRANGTVEAFTAGLHQCGNDHHSGQAASAPAGNDYSATMDEIVKAGLRVLAQRVHPDHGGSNEDMLQLNLAAERLRAMLDALRQSSGAQA